MARSAHGRVYRQPDTTTRCDVMTLLGNLLGQYKIISSLAVSTIGMTIIFSASQISNSGSKFYYQAIWHFLGAWLAVYVMLEAPELLKRITRISAGPVDLELNITQEKRARINNEFNLSGSIFVSQGDWKKAASMFIEMRNSEDYKEQIKGLLASCEMIISMCDKNVSFDGSHLCRRQRFNYLLTARKLCNEALKRNQSLGLDAAQTAAIFHQRAIIRCRFSDHESDAEAKRLWRCKGCKSGMASVASVSY